MTGPIKKEPAVPLSDDPFDDPWDEMEARQSGGSSFDFDLSGDDAVSPAIEDEEVQRQVIRTMLTNASKGLDREEMIQFEGDVPDTSVRLLQSYLKMTLNDRRRIEAMEVMLGELLDLLQIEQGVPAEKRTLAADGSINEESPMAKLMDLVTSIKDGHHRARMGDRKQFNLQINSSYRQSFERQRKFLKVKTNAQAMERILELSALAISIASGGVIDPSDL